jgi:hypothetical protein
VIEYRSLILEDKGFIQGRYLLPLAPVAGAVAGAGVAALRGRAQSLAAAFLLGGVVALQLGSLAIVTGRFYG